MFKWLALIVALLACAGLIFSLAQRQSLRHASLIMGRHELLTAYDHYAKTGQITNYSSSYRVWLSTNVVNIAGIRYQCFAEVGGWGYDGATLAMTTNRIFIWLDPEHPAKILTNGYRPKLFSSSF